jgi:hypothetical protein
MNDYHVMIVIGIIVLIVIAFLIYLRIRGLDGMRKDAYELFRKVEKLYSDDEGTEKMDYVVDAIYAKLPTALQMFLPVSVLRKILQKWFTDIKDFLDNGEMDKSAELDCVKKARELAEAEKESEEEETEEESENEEEREEEDE